MAHNMISQNIIMIIHLFFMIISWPLLTEKATQTGKNMFLFYLKILRVKGTLSPLGLGLLRLFAGFPWLFPFRTLAPQQSGVWGLWPILLTHRLHHNYVLILLSRAFPSQFSVFLQRFKMTYQCNGDCGASKGPN